MSDFDYSKLAASGALGQSNVGSGAAVGQSQQGSGNMLPFEGKTLELPGGNVDDVINNSANADKMFSPLNQGGGPFGQSLTTQLGESAGYLGTPEAKGDNIALENLGQGERQAPPTVHGDLQLKDFTARGNAPLGG